MFASGEIGAADLKTRQLIRKKYLFSFELTSFHTLDERVSHVARLAAANSHVVPGLAISIDTTSSLTRILALLEVASLVRRAVRVDSALGLTTDLRIAVEFWQARASRFSVQKNAFGVDTTRAWVA